VSHVAEFDQLLAELPQDWSFFECYVGLDDPTRLAEARVALSRANARPLYGQGDHDFAITVAHAAGRGARAGVVRSALKLLDDLGVGGRTWVGEVRTRYRPAAPHRFGP
jgi:hypothetical protein